MTFNLPTLNATLNALAGIFLFLGWRAIKAKKPQIHRRYMITAMICSMLFLCSYITYHILIHGVTHYQKKGIWRVIYFLILGTHTPLAGIIVPASLTAVWFALRGDFKRHTAVTRWLYPVWMYVSITGVIIYLMLYIF